LTECKRVILAVDDSPVILKSISSALSDAYKVFVLPKPMELERVLQKIIPDLFLVDFHMPERNGLQLIPVIRSYERHRETPVLFLSSAESFESICSAVELGACDFLIKPFEPDGLRERVKALIGN